MALIPDAAPLAAADPADRDGDGVSGRVRWHDAASGRRPGRFGWKTDHASLAGQVADALAADLGLASPDRPSAAGDCGPAQPACLAEAGSGAPVPARDLDRLLAYVGGLRPRPAPALGDTTGRGESLFGRAGCAACHGGPFVVAADAAVSGRPVERIAFFTDLFLHDLGPALADSFPDGSDAAPGEWRTAPLWGLRHRGAALLHDGHAATPREAILWHGGEAAGSRAQFLALPAAEQATLLAFLASL